jgi:hypothetical protein
MSININFKLTNASNSSCAVGYGKTYIVTTSGYCANNLALSTEQQCKDAASATGKSYSGIQTDTNRPKGCYDFHSYGAYHFNPSQSNNPLFTCSNNIRCICPGQCTKCPDGFTSTGGETAKCTAILGTCNAGYGIEIETKGGKCNTNENLTKSECEAAAHFDGAQFSALSSGSWGIDIYYPSGCWYYTSGGEKYYKFNPSTTSTAQCDGRDDWFCVCKASCKKCIAPSTSNGGMNAHCEAPKCNVGYGTGYEILTSGKCEFQITSEEECYMAHKWLGTSNTTEVIDGRRLVHGETVRGCVRYSWGGASFSMKEKLESYNGNNYECGKDGQNCICRTYKCEKCPAGTIRSTDNTTCNGGPVPFTRGAAEQIMGDSASAGAGVIEGPTGPVAASGPASSSDGKGVYIWYADTVVLHCSPGYERKDPHSWMLPRFDPRCEPCDAGYFSKGGINVKCSQCAVGTVSVVGASECVNLNAIITELATLKTQYASINQQCKTTSNDAGGRRLNIDCGAGTVDTVGKGTILDPVISTTIAPSVDNSSASISTTTKISRRSRSTNELDENDEQELSNGSMNLLSAGSSIFLSIMVIYITL